MFSRRKHFQKKSKTWSKIQHSKSNCDGIAMLIADKTDLKTINIAGNADKYFIIKWMIFI